MKTTAPVMKLVHRIDRNTRALAKVVSALHFLRDEYAGFAHVHAAAEVLSDALDTILAERRALRAALWQAIDHQQVNA